MHEAFVNDIMHQFTAALQKDRLYLNACSFVQQNGIWILATLMKYLVKQVLHFSHADFVKAVKIDLQPFVSNSGLWML